MRHRLQTVVVFIISGLAIAVGAMGGTLLVQSSSPYDQVFDALNGPHLVVTFDAGKVSSSDVVATASLAGVAAAAGPWPIASLPFEKGSTKFGLRLIGRDDPGGKLDRVQIVQGRWVTDAGEVVVTRSFAIGQHISIGDRITSLGTPAKPVFTVVGEAVDVNPLAFRGWVSSKDARSMGPSRDSRGYQMAYRLHSAASRSDIQAAVKAIEGTVPPGAVSGHVSYLDFRDEYNFNNSLILTFLLAFAALALGAVAVIVANVVTGAVLANYREIGILKAIGFTPGDVVLVFAIQMLVPALAAAVVGIPLGVLASKPLLDMAADAMSLPPPSPVAPGIDALALVVGLGIVAVAAALPAWRAGRLNAVAAITTGTAPSGRWSTSLHGSLGWWQLPRAIAVGAGDAFARPLRGSLTAIAILVGVATLVFASGLYAAILKFNDLFTSPNDQVIVSRYGGFSDQATMDVLQQQPDTRGVIGYRQLGIALPGQVDPVSAQIFRGPSDRLGFGLAEGRWFSGPGEAVVGVVFNPYHWRVGQAVDAVVQGKPMQLRVTGTCYCFFTLSMDWSTLTAADPAAQPFDYLVQLGPGANPDAYVKNISAAQPDFLAPRVVGLDSGFNIEGILDALVVALAVILGAIAGLGVFNTLLLNTRERVRDIAILKALGMTPREVTGMVVTSACVLGVVGALLGIPAGIALYVYLVDAMARVANFTVSRDQLNIAIGPVQLAVVALAGVLVAVVGAVLPARWAARAPVAGVLNIE